MFETFLQRLLAAIGAGDQLIAVMGPSFTILLAWIIGGAIAQFLKFPMSRAVAEPWFSYLVRVIAIQATFVFLHFLSDTVPLWLEIGMSFLQPVIYGVTLAVIRQYWPWLEAKKYVGAVYPPDTAYIAEMQRDADKAFKDDSK